MLKSARDVLAERRRQVEAEGWTPEHDDAHDKGELAEAAAAYALHRPPMGLYGHGYHPPKFWPWSLDWWKSVSRRRDLVKAGALILAEIDRLDRAAPPVESLANLADATPIEPPTEAREDGVNVLSSLNRMVTDYLTPDTYKARFPRSNAPWYRDFPMPDKHHSEAGAHQVNLRRDQAFINDVIHLQDNPLSVKPREPEALTVPSSTAQTGDA